MCVGDSGFLAAVWLRVRRARANGPAAGKRLAALAAAMALACVVLGCTAPQQPAVLPDDAALRALDIPADATRTAPPASETRGDAVAIETDAPATFYTVNPGVDNWFAFDDTARVIGWSTIPGTEVNIYLVTEDGTRSDVDTGGLQQPLSTPEPGATGNGAGQRYIMQDDSAPGPAYLVFVARTYNNESGVMGVKLSSAW